MIDNIDSFGFQWHITDRCNGRCRHCYQDRFGGANELPLDVLKNIADHIMTFFRDILVSINLTGGEPFSYDGIFELMSHISSYPNIDELNIITSARWDDAFVEATAPGRPRFDGSEITAKLKSIPKLTSVKVSLESHDPQVNDNIRGAGHFDMVSQNIRALSQAGLRVIIMATLGKHNYHTVEGLCEYITTVGASGIILERYVPLGRGKDLSNDVLTSSEWDEIIHTVIRIAEIEDVSINDLRPYRAFRIDMFDDAPEVSGALCNLGPSSMALMPDGTVYPCRRCPTPVAKLPHDNMEYVISILNEYATRPQQCYSFDF